MTDHAHEYIDGHCVVCYEREDAKPAVWQALGRDVLIVAEDEAA